MFGKGQEIIRNGKNSHGLGQVHAQIHIDLLASTGDLSSDHV